MTELADEKNVGMTPDVLAKDESADGSFVNEKHAGDNKLQRQLKNRHIAMIRYVQHRTSIHISNTFHSILLCKKNSIGGESCLPNLSYSPGVPAF